MKCDKCDSEATVHEVRIESGKRREQHLCEQCARSQGVGPVQVGTPITQLLSGQFLTQLTPGAPAPQTGPASARAAQPCPGCGLTYAQFRNNGLLGCQKCYDVFEGQLGPLLARAHEGGTQHTGKSPRRPIPGVPAETLASSATAVAASPSQPVAATAPAPAKPAVDPQAEARAVAQRIALLKKRLAEAIAAEQYEKAARYRDELAKLEGRPAKPGSPVAPAQAQATPKRKPPPAGPAKEGDA